MTWQTCAPHGREASPRVPPDRWLLFRHAGRGAELYDLADERRELLWHPFDDDEDNDLRPELEALYPPPPFLAEEDAAKFLEATRCGGPTSAIAISPDGAHVALGTTIGATFVIERDTLGITLVPGAGPAIAWQPPRAEVVGPLVCGAPESPDHATIELGAGRHYVIVGEGDNAIIHTRTAKVERVAFLPRASLDGTHFTVPEGPDGPYRRWRIYGADTTPIASFESNHKLDHLAVLPNGRRIGWTRDLLVTFAADGTQRFAARGFGKDLAAVCPSADGEHVITYDTEGTFRRWAT